MIDPRHVPQAPDTQGPVPDGWVRVDFHMHTYGSGDAVTTVDEFGAAVEAAGLDVVCVTDHNAVRVAQALATELDVRVVIGEEVKTHSGELIGLFLRDRISFGLDGPETARRIKDQGGIIYVPHPTGQRANAMNEDGMLEIMEAGLLDAVEVFNARSTLDRNQAAAAFATEHGLPGGAGSDAHYPDEIGAAWLLMPDFDSPADLLVKMAEGRVAGRRHEPQRATWRSRIIPSSDQ